jgi:trigger factor
VRGIELDFHATIKGIKKQDLPELNDALAAQIIPGSDLAGLKETIRGNLEHQLNQQIEELKVSQLLEKLNRSVQFDLPDELVTAETQGQADEMVERGLGSGMSEDEIAARQEEIFTAANQRAQMNLRTDFILQRIAEAEEVQVSQEELANRVASMANQAKKPIKGFAKDLQQSGRLRGLQHSMLLSKTIDFLLEHAKVEVSDEIPAEEPAPVDADAPEEPASADTEEATNDDE